MAEQIYYANAVPDAVASGTWQLLEACNAWPHQTTPPNLSDPNVAGHLSICYVARHPDALTDQVMTGVVWGVLATLGVLMVLSALLIALDRLRRRKVRQPTTSLKVPLGRIVQADQEREHDIRALQDLHAELSLDARGGGRKHSL